MTKSIWLGVLLLSLTALDAQARHHHSTALESGEGLDDTTVLIIRHAEKPDDGPDLSAAGRARAQAYVGYFENLKLDGKPARPEAIFATAPSKSSNRPAETVEPLAHALGLPLDDQYKNDDFAGLANALRGAKHGHTVLICWHHGEIPDLLRGLGAEPAAVIPGAKWPGDQFGWLIALTFDAKGAVARAQRIEERLMPGDAP